MSKLSAYEHALVRFREQLIAAHVQSYDRPALLTAFREVYELGLTEGANAANEAARAMAKTVNLLTEHIDEMERVG